MYATAAAGLALTVGCGSEAPTRIEIAAHYVPACSPAAQDAPPQLELTALGDFDRSNDSVAILASDASLRSLDLPATTRAAQLQTLGAGGFWGSGALGAHNRLPILLWPRARACALARFDAADPNAASAEPGAWTLGASGRLETLLAAGPVGADRSVEWTFVDLNDAAASPLGLDARSQRQQASLSELGDELVLAGGLDAASGAASRGAAIFDPALGRFTDESPSLAVARARHAALGLPGGQSLLIGGVSDAGEALSSVEVLSRDGPRFSRLFELLERPRVEPRAVLLGPNRILVGGGYGLDAAGARTPLDTVEFLSTDLTDVAELPLSLPPAAFDRAFVALGSGAALAVGGCAAGVQGDADVDCVPCDGGCVSRAVWWIDPLGRSTLLDQLPLALSVAAPKLVAGTGGSPWIIADGRLGRFDPWLARFVPVEAGRSASGARVLGDPVSIRPGLFAWLEANADGVELVGFYHSQRGPFAQDVAPLLVGSADGVVPHSPPTLDDGGVRLEYSAATGLELAGAAAVVSIADTDYAAFTLELSSSSGAPPLLQLVGASGEPVDAAFGGLDCPWPDDENEPAPDPRAPVRLRVQRDRDRVRLERLENGIALEPRPEPCQRSLPERVGIQLVGTPAGPTVLGRIEIRRSVD
ncbi:MAG TPA: hypothetical protein VMG12_08230 [Polyangiaceae bacterium]|nr:hypothetical protein [Polyangiaceae bacterium]